MDFTEFLVKIKEIEKGGYVKSHRTGDTGIGKTLEDLLGLVENNIAGPDFSVYELKSGRKDSSSMLTLFTKVPMPSGANRELLRVFGYKQRDKSKKGTSQPLLPHYLGSPEIADPEVDIREKELHVTVDSLKPNSVGLKLEIRGNTVYIANEKGVKAYYEENYLKNAFENKYKHRLVYVLASNKKEERIEYFWYNEAHLLGGFSFENFADAIGKGIVKLDLRIGHYPDGRPHDHGTGFRVLPKNLPLCFAEIEKLL